MASVSLSSFAFARLFFNDSFADFWPHVLQKVDPNSYRRTWDKDEFEKRVKDRLAEEEAGSSCMCMNYVWMTVGHVAKDRCF